MKSEMILEMEKIVYANVENCIVNWSNKLTKSLAIAGLKTRIITFSNHLDFTRRDDNIKTALHEIAHILAMDNNKNYHPKTQAEAHSGQFEIEYNKLLRKYGYEIATGKTVRYAAYTMPITKAKHLKRGQMEM